MRRFTSLIIAGILLGAASQAARAGLISLPTDSYITSVTITQSGDGVVQAVNDITDGAPDQHTVTAQVDGDPMLNLGEYLNNSSGQTWNTYDLTIQSLTPGVTAVFSTAPGATSSASPYFQSPPVVTPTMIHFSGPSALPDGFAALLSYAIILTPPVGYSGPISWQITETPGVGAVPEPASLMVMGLGVVGLVARRKRN